MQNSEEFYGSYNFIKVFAEVYISNIVYFFNLYVSIFVEYFAVTLYPDMVPILINYF